MKKNFFFLSCALAMTGFVASAGDVTPAKMHGMYDMAKATEAPAMAKPLSYTGVGDKVPVKIFGSTYMDNTSTPHMVNVDPTNLYNIEFVSVAFPEDDYRIKRVLSGEYVNGTYYANLESVYTFTMHYDGWATIDTNTGKISILRDIAKEYGYNKPYNYEDPSYNFYRINDMAYNPVDGKLYGVAYDTDGGFNPVLGTVNMQNGVFTPIANFDGFVSAITFDLEGNLYGAHNVGTYMENWYNESEGTEIARFDYKNLDEDGCVSNVERIVMLDMPGEDVYRVLGQGTMTIDKTTGTLYYFVNGYLNGEFSTQDQVFSVDMRNRTATYLGKLGWHDMLVGAAIIDTESASDRKAPAQVCDYAIAFDANGANELTVTWTNPVSAWDLTDLVDLTAMKVAVDSKDNVVATLNASLATPSYSYTVKDLTTGAHTIYVYAVNSKGDGVPSSLEMWAGHDKPGVPGKPEVNVSTLDGETVIINWTAPTEGMNGGWFDAANVKYNIVRMPDNVTVATGVDGLTFTDETIPEVRSYYYIITGVTADGEGAPMNTDQIAVGGALTVPYVADFTDPSIINAFEVFDGAGFRYGDAYNGFYKRLSVEISRFPANYYFATPKFMLKGGHTYNVKFDAYFNYPVDSYHQCYTDYEVLVGTEASPEALTTVLLDVEDSTVPYNYSTKEVEVWYTPEEDGEYVFAYHIDTDKSTEDINGIVGFSIFENYDTDLQAVSLSGTQFPAMKRESVYTARIYNNGNKDVKGTKVEVVRRYGDYTIATVGSAVYNEVIPSHEYVDIDVTINPDSPTEGYYCAHVVTDGDFATSNDYSAPLYVQVLMEGSMPLNHKITGEYPDLRSSAPIGYAHRYYGMQSIYLADDLNYSALKDPVLDEPVRISGIAYPFALNEGVDGDLGYATVDLDVYMSNSTRKSYKRMGQAIIPADQTKVYSGNMTIKGGDNRFMYIPLDEPFELEEGKSLIITLVQNGGTAKHEYPLSFEVFNSDWNIADSRSIMHHGSTPYPINAAPAESTGATYIGMVPLVPVVWLAVPTSETGIEGIFVDSATGDINLGGLENAFVKVFDIAGKTVFAGEYTGSLSALPVAEGLYIVNVTVDGNEANFKVRINR